MVPGRAAVTDRERDRARGGRERGREGSGRAAVSSTVREELKETAACGVRRDWRRRQRGDRTDGRRELLRAGTAAEAEGQGLQCMAGREGGKSPQAGMEPRGRAGDWMGAVGGCESEGVGPSAHSPEIPPQGVPGV